MNSKRLFAYFATVFCATFVIIAHLCPAALWLLCALPSFGVFSWIAAYALYDWLNTETVDSRDKIVLITGCDTGFGNATAKRLDLLGK